MCGKGEIHIMGSDRKKDDDQLAFFKPDVYQHDIYDIDYKKLWDAGIRLISFDIDDTIAGYEKGHPEDDAVELFKGLKEQGFKIMLLSNNSNKKRAETFAADLGIPEQYIRDAQKPASKNFVKMQEEFGLKKEEMAHVGNIMSEDILGGNSFGITTCLVRRKGKWGWVKDRVRGRKEIEHQWSEELKDNDMWRKHHKYEKHDQYYQLGEEPLYKKREEGELK
jgi:hypothetical protein